MPCHLSVNSQEIATLLAALRHFQKSTKLNDRKSWLHFEQIEPLTDNEIDVLCEKINCPNEPQVIPFLLNDCGEEKGAVEGRIDVWPSGIEIFIDGYGRATTEPGCGSPIDIVLCEQISKF